MLFTPSNLLISLPNALPGDSESTFSVLDKSQILFIHTPKYLYQLSNDIFFVPNQKFKCTSLLSFPSKPPCFQFSWINLHRPIYTPLVNFLHHVL